MRNTYELAGKRVLLTGANGRLGQAYTAALLENGAFVYVTDIQKTIDSSLKSVLTKKKLKNYTYITLDITSEDSLAHAEKLIKKPIDVLINNAGAKGVKGPFEVRTADDIAVVMDVQLKGTILCTRVFSKRMIQKRGGKIINIASIYGIVAPDKKIYDDPKKINSEIYGATKAGIIQFTKYLAAYLGEYRITANCISIGGVYHAGQSPSFVKKYTAKTPLGRMANPDDLIDIICFLASDGAQYITGQNIAVDGGFTA